MRRSVVLTAASMCLILGPAAANGTRPDLERLTLQAAFQRALEQSETVRIAEYERDAARTRWSSAWSELLPRSALTVTGMLQREQRVGSEVFQPGEAVVGNIAVQQPVFRRSFYAHRDAGRLDHEGREAALTRSRERLMRDVAAAFIAVLEAREILTVARAAADRARAQHAHARGRVEAGGALPTAELLARVEWKGAEIRVVEAERIASAAAVSFERLIGAPPPPALELPENAVIPSLEEALQAAERRADVEVVRLRGEEARARERAAWSRLFWPRLDLEGSAEARHPEVLGVRFDWRVQGVLTLPLFDGAIERFEAALHENEAVRAAIEEKRRVEIAHEEVRQAFLRLESAVRASALAGEQVSVAKEHYELVETQFRLGAVTFLEVATAQAAFAEAESLKEVVRFDRELARYDLLFAAGML